MALIVEYHELSVLSVLLLDSYYFLSAETWLIDAIPALSAHDRPLHLSRGLSAPCFLTWRLPSARQELEAQWSELQEVLGERLREGRTRSDSLSAYEKLKEDVLTWLTRMEGSIDQLQPVAVDQKLLKEQSDELKVGGTTADWLHSYT